jgi:SAM-dependent methyltransferase
VSFITENDGQFAYFDTLLGRPVWKGKRILDFGGNIGNILQHPNSTITHDWYWCLDVSRDAIEAGKKAAPNANFVFYDRHNFEYNPNGIRNLPIPDVGKEFDFILALSVFTHTSKTEMIEIVKHLSNLLNDGGRLAFSFFDPHYIPPESDACNLKYYIQLGTTPPPFSEIDVLMNRASGASWCALPNGELEIEREGMERFRGLQEESYLAFYTPRYLQTIFPWSRIVNPIDPFPRQHCCIISDGQKQ